LGGSKPIRLRYSKSGGRQRGQAPFPTSIVIERRRESNTVELNYAN